MDKQLIYTATSPDGVLYAEVIGDLIGDLVENGTLTITDQSNGEVLVKETIEGTIEYIDNYVHSKYITLNHG